jgi:hypothetical protein
MTDAELRVLIRTSPIPNTGRGRAQPLSPSSKVTDAELRVFINAQAVPGYLKSWRCIAARNWSNS